MKIPEKFKYLTTWNWWLVVIVSILHLLKLTPGVLASGLFPIALVTALVGSALFVGCNTTNVCPTKHYKRYTQKYDLKHTALQFEQIVNEENISSHLFPLLLLSGVLLTNPTNTLWWQRFCVAAIVATIYNFHSYTIGPDVTQVYNLPYSMYFCSYFILLSLSFIPV